MPTAGIPAAEVPTPRNAPATAGQTIPSPSPSPSPSPDPRAAHGTGPRSSDDPAARAPVSGPTSVPGAGPVLGRDGRGVDADFDMARAHFDRGESAQAQAALEGFVKRNPDHGSRLSADLMLARLALQRSAPKEAKRILEPWVDGRGAAAAATAAAGPGSASAPRSDAAPNVGGNPAPDGATAAGNEIGDPKAATPRAAATYYLGLAEVRIGNLERGRELLLPFLPKGSPEVDPTDEAGIELRGALAEAVAPTDPAAALDLWNAYFRVGRGSEKAWSRKRAAEIATQLNPEVAWRAYGAATPSGLTRATLGSKAALYLRARGDSAGATFIESETNAARHALGFESALSRVGPGDPNRIGLAIPLSGKLQVVGEAALRAAMLAGGAPVNAAPAGGPHPSRIIVRDTGTDAERAGRSVTELTRVEAVIGVVGAGGSKMGGGAVPPGGGGSGLGAVSQASQDGIPFLSLDDAAPGALTSAFQMIHSADMRARTLANQAMKMGVRSFAILGPDHAASRKLREAFRKAVTEGGGVVVVESTYVPGVTSFAPAVAALKKVRFQAIFVPDSSERIALVAPALAVADLWPQPWSPPPAAAAAAAAAAGAPAGKTKFNDKANDKDKARPVLLLSTANDLSMKLVDHAGRYVQGALLCPGFFAADSDARARGFVDAYRAAYAQDPHAVEAYAYDAVATFRLLSSQGAHTRADMIRALGARDGTPLLAGLTGNLTFGPDHGRIDAPPIYIVDGSDIRALR